MGVQVSPLYPDLGSCGVSAWEWDSGVTGSLFLVFRGASILISTVAAPIYTPTSSVGQFFPLRTPSPEFVVCFLEDG
jgi:hypothetical protein